MKLLEKRKFTPSDKGVIYSFLSVLPYSIIPLIFLIHFTGAPDNFQGSMARGAVTTMGKDFLSLILLSIFIILKDRDGSLFRFFKTKGALVAGIAGVLGGPIGYTCFNASFYMAGAAYGHIFTSLEPIILGISMYFMFKRKFKWQAIMGIVITSVGVVAMIAGESTSSSGHTSDILIGSFLGIGGSVAWAVESLLMDRVFTFQPETKIEHAIVAKQLFSAVFGFAIMFPATGAGIGDVSLVFHWFGELFTNVDYLWRMIVVAFLIIISRQTLYLGIKYKGATFAAIVYELTVVLVPILSLIGYSMGVYVIEDYQLGLTWQLVFWFCSAGIIGGTILVVLYTGNIDRTKEKAHKKLDKDSIK